MEITKQERDQAVQALRDCVTLIDDMSRFAGRMTLKNYSLFNTATSDANRAIAALSK